VLRPRLAAYLVAAALVSALAHSVYRIPIQVSDSLEPILVGARASSSAQLFSQAIHFSDITLRPLRHLQARWLLQASDFSGLSYTAVFRGFHAALVVLIALVFVQALHVNTWLDFSAAAIPLTVLAGLHTSLGLMREGFPVNHFAEVSLAALAVFAMSRGRPSAWKGALALALLAFSLLLYESGALVWVVIVVCAGVGFPGLSRRMAVAATAVLMLYGAARFQLGIGAPGIGESGSGYGATFYSGSELRERFGDAPAGFRAYNIAGGLASMLLSEPRFGVYQTVRWWRGEEVHPVLFINVISSLLITLAIGWYVVSRRRTPPREWSDEDRSVAVAIAVIAVNALMTTSYIKDEILTVAGVFYAIAAYVAIRAVLLRVSDGPRQLPAMVLLAVLIAITGTLWTFRAAGVHYQLREAAFNARNEWVELLPPSRPPASEDDARVTLTQRLKEEALMHRGASTSDLPAWGERYWVE
jgi:hypothetical protein